MEKIRTIKTRIKSEESYSIVSGFGCLQRRLLEEHISFSDYVLFVDSEVDRLHRPLLSSVFPERFDDRIIVPSGESSKSMVRWAEYIDKLLARGVTRNTVVFSVGGGVVGDLVGFVAASTLRGIPLVHIPTTLLAMVDSSIGGKTGVNHECGKNLVGSFYQPKLVLCDTQFLSTLSEREFFSGLGEVMKYALLSSLEDATKLMSYFPTPSSSSQELDFWIEHGVKSKVYYVENDEKESGIRAYLNLGHTFAHAIEATLGYGIMAHGEAVYWGMMAALFCSKKLGAPVDPEILMPAKRWYGKTPFLNKDTISRAVSFMKQDKKVQSKDQIRLVLLKDYGKAYTTAVQDVTLVLEGLNFIIEKHTAD